MSTAPRVDYQTDPTQYRHWKLKFEGPVATLAADFDENAGLRPGYKLKLNSYDLGVDIELNDAVNRIRFEHPEVRTVVVTSAQREGVLLRRQHLHARRVEPCLEGELLQVHQRDAERPRGLVAAQRAEVPRRRQRRLRRRRLRAGAGLRRDRPRRRPLVGGQPARGAAARRAAGHRRPDARHRQAPCAPRPGRHLLHHQRRRARPEGEGLAARRRHRQAGGVRPHGAGARARARPAERPPGRREGRRADAARPHDRGRRAALRPCRGRDRPRAPHRELRREGAVGRSSRPTSPASRPPAPPGIRWRWRASSRTRSCRCAPTSSTSAPG